MKTKFLSLLAAFAAVVPVSVSAQTAPVAPVSLGWHTFDYGSTTALPQSSISLFEGQLTITGRNGITDYYGGAGSLTNGTASTLFYTHHTDVLIGGIGTTGTGIHSDLSSSSELVFQFNNGVARLDEMALIVNGLDFGLSAYDILSLPGYNLENDDPFLWMNTSAGLITLNEQQIRAATSFLPGEGTLLSPGLTSGDESGYIDFASFTGALGLGTEVTVSSFGLRETYGDIYLKDVIVNGFIADAPVPVPEPGSALLLGLAALPVLRRRRKAQA